MEKALEAYLHNHIPIAKAMGLVVEQASLHQVVLKAPLLNNINHKKTAFGGSLHAVATLACWSLLHLNLRETKDPLQIVIAKSEVDFLAPLTIDFRAEATLPPKHEWERFLNIFHKKGKGRLSMQARIMQDGKMFVDYSGVFVALTS